MNKSSLKVLALDDDHFTLELFFHMLNGLGFGSVTTCDNGHKALELVRVPADSPNLILLDLNMPHMDGLEFVRKLVEESYAGSLILVSGEEERTLQMAEKMIRAHRITVLGHLRKPIEFEQLIELMEKWLPEIPSSQPKKSYSRDEIQAAIAHGELINYYQPKVEVSTGAVVGVETLLRWRHPLDGLVLPDQFIGTAEESGLIDLLTHMVLAEAMRQTKLWQETGLALRVAINVSMDNLSSVSFADLVADAAAGAGVAPHDIVLEVTESRLMLDQRAPLEVLSRLRLKHFHLSIDDFGTGYSSLTQLRDIPFDEIKIDQSFVHGAGRDKTTRAIYDASLGLGRQLGMKVVAEGVEDIDDWNLVKRTGCDLAQGYFIAHPMLPADFPAWIASWNANIH